MDPSRLLSDDELYQRSLMLEPRSSRLSGAVPSLTAHSGQRARQAKSHEKFCNSPSCEKPATHFNENELREALKKLNKFWFGLAEVRSSLIGL